MDTKTISAQTVTVKQDVLAENVVDVEPAGTEKFDDEKIAAYEMLCATMQKGYCSLYKSSFEDKAGQHRDDEVEDLTKPVNLILKDPPYNTWRKQNRKTSSHDVLLDEYMERFMECVQEVLERRRHGIIF